MFKSIAELKRANRELDHHWFSRDTMRFFRSRIESGLFGGRFFVTSEQYLDDSPRLYTIRRANEDGSVETVGTFQRFGFKASAIAKAKELAKNETQKIR